MYFRMILFSYTCIVIILELVVAIQADTKPTLINNELSLSHSNEQVTEYNYKRNIQSTVTENNQDHSIKKNINTEFVQEIHSSNELDLNVATSSDLNSALNMLNNNEASITNDYGTQMSTLELSNTEVKIVGDNAFMSANGVQDSINYNNPTNTNEDLTDKQGGQDYDSNGNKISDTSVINKYQSSSYYEYNVQNIVDQNGEIPTTAASTPGSNGSPSSATPTSPNGNSNSGPNSKQKAAPPSTPASTSTSNGSPSSSSPKSPTGDSSGIPNGQGYDSNGNKISDTSVINKYQSSSYYEYNVQNIVDQNGEIPTTAASTPGSNGSPSSATPTSPNGNSNSGPNSKQKAAPPSTPASTSTSNGSPSSSSPKSPTGDSSGIPNGQGYDSNGNKISDTSVMNKYQSPSYYAYNTQNIVDQNGEIPTTAASTQGSNGSPSSATPTSPNGNSNSGPNSKQKAAPPSTPALTSTSNGSPSSSSPKSLTGDSSGIPNGQGYDSNGNKISDTSVINKYQSSSYYEYNVQNIVDQNGEIPTTAASTPGSNGSPSSATPTSPNGNSNSGPNSKQKAAPPSTPASTSTSNGSPSSSSPKSPTGDSSGIPNGQGYDSNGNKISDTSVMNKYQSPSYYAYNTQNIVDQNGEIPTTAASTQGSNGSPSSATPTSPNGNSNSGPNSKQKAAPPSTPALTSTSNGSPSSSSPKSLTGDSSGIPNGQGYDSNGNKISDTSVINKYQSSSYYEYNVQNIVDQNGEIPTTAASTPGSNGSPSSATPTSPNGNSNSGPNSKQKAAPPSTPASTSTSNGSPSSSSPKSPTGDSSGIPNGQGYDSNGNKISDTSVMNKYQSPSYYAYNTQNIVDQNGEIPTTAASTQGSNGSPSSATPTSPNGNSNSGPNSKQKAAPPSTPASTSTSNGSPSSSSPKSPTGDSSGIPNGQGYDSNGNKISDTSVMNKYQSPSYYAYNTQNIVDQNGEIPTTAASTQGSNGSPSSATPTSPNGNSNSGPNSKQKAAPPSTPASTSTSNGSPSSSSPKSPTGDSSGIPNGQGYDSNGNKISDTSVINKYQSSSYYEYNVQNIVDQNGEIPTTAASTPGSNGSPSSATPTSPNGNSNSGPNSKQKAAPPSTPASTSTSNGSPSSSSPKSPTGDSSGIPNGQGYDSNGNKISDTSVMNKYQSPSYYAYNTQNIVDQNGEIPTTAASTQGSNGSPSSATPTSPNGNSNSGPNSKQKAAPPSTPASTSTSNGSPSSSSPKSPTGDSSGIPNGQGYDSNGNKISDTSVINKYQSSSYYEYNVQNIVDQNGEIPTTAASTPGSNGSPSSATPTSPNGNSNSGPNSKQKAAPPSTPASTSTSNGSPSSSSPKSPTGDSSGIPNGQGYDSNGNKISDTSVMNKYQSPSYYAYNTQNIVDQNGEIPTTAASTQGSNGSPSSATPTSPNGNSNSGPNSKQKAAPPSTPASTSTSNGSPSSSSPKSPTGDSSGIPNGQGYDSNGNKISDTSVINKYQSSSYYEYNVQNIVDQNGEIPTTAASTPGSNGSPSSATPTSPNGNSNSGPNSKQKAAPPSTPASTSTSNGSPSSSSPKSPTGDSSGIPNGQGYDSNGNKISDTSVMNKYQSPSYYAYNTQNIVDQNGEIPTTAASTQGSNGSPSSATPTSPNGNSNSGPNSKQKAAPPSTPASTSTSNGSPSSSSSKSPTGDSSGIPNGQGYDSNGNKISDTSVENSYQSSNYYGYIQNTVDHDTSYNYPPEMSEYLNNQLLQNSVASFSLQNTATPDQFGIIPSSSLNMQNGNSKDSPSGGGTGLNTQIDMNGSPYAVDQAQTGTEYSSFGSETYGSSNFDTDYELRNMDVVEILNEGQLIMADMYISDNYDDVNNDGVNTPPLNENGDVYNNYFYADNSVKTLRSSNGNFDTQNDGNYVDGYFGNVPFDGGNMQEPSYEPYAPNLNARYENSQLQYGLNQNPPPFIGYPYMGNDIAPFDTNIYPDISPQTSIVNSDLYNYNNIDSIEYDQTKIGIDETSPENIQLSMSDLNTFSSSQISQTTDGFIDTDLISDHLAYGSVDAGNRDLETIDSNYIGQVNENNVYNGQGFNGYNNMQSINVPEYNQFNGDYTTTYSNNLGTFETSYLNTGTDAAVDGPEGPYLTPQLLNSKYDLPTSRDLNKQSSDSNSFLIDNVQLNGYLYRKTDTSNLNTQVEDSAAVNSNGSPMNVIDNRFKSIQTTVLSKNNEFDVGQNVYGANGQVIGIIYKPSGIVKTKNRHKYSGSSSYSSPSDSEFSDDMLAIGHDIKRAARDAIDNVHDNIKDAYDTTKAVGKAVGNIAENAASKAADGVGKAADDVEKTAKIAYQGTKDVAKGVGNAVGEAANDVGETAKTAYQGSKDVAKGVGNAVEEAANDVGETAKTAYQGSKDVAKGVGNAVGEAANDVEESAKTAYQGSKDVANGIENAVSDAADDVEETA